MKMRNSIYVMHSLLLFCLFLMAHFSFAVVSISANQSLSGDQTIVSKGGNFKLGFFRPGNASKYYIGIWYENISEHAVVWVANRVNPVSDKYSSHLTIQDGNLVLLNESNTPVWSTNVSSTNSSSLMAILLDDGNLKLIDGLSNINSTPAIWQSFDNPTDSFLPGGKLSYNKISKTKQLLTSWRNSEDPAPGLFSLELLPSEKQCIIKWNKTKQYWSSGEWNGRFFSTIPEMNSNTIYNFSFVDNENESYVTYSLHNPTVITRFVMDISGQIKQRTWLDSTRPWNMLWAQPRRQCDVYAYCGAFGICNENSLPFCDCLPGFKHKSDEDWNRNDFSGGCIRVTKLQCESNSSTPGQRDKFQVLEQMRLPDDSQAVAVGSAAECQSACLSSCSCTAYAYESDGCSIWNREILNLKQLSVEDGNIGKTLYLRLAASEFSTAKDNKGIVIRAVLGCVAVALVLVGLIWLVILRRQRRLARTRKPAEGLLVAFTYKDLQKATKNFSEKLGGGGFGSVFKGTLPDSSIIAVKKLESVSQGEKQFRTEVSTIGTIQHVNLVRLRGFCSEGMKKLLVYDYMPNGSLDAHLFQENDSQVLDWRTRYQIALGTARGLAYLHEKCRDCIIHCDIKPENILLDAEFCPKVADFGLAKLVGRDFSRVLTTMRGTIGYLAPEWISGVAITAKADVYSYGMMLFEVISGKRNSEHSVDAVTEFFPTWAAKVVVDGGDILCILDPRLNRIADEEEISRLCKIACWCVQDDENNRPSMVRVVQFLEGVLDVNLPPLPRILQMFDNQEIVFFTKSSTSNQTSQTRRTNSTSSADFFWSATSSKCVDP